jgi:hypothetical protein
MGNGRAGDVGDRRSTRDADGLVEKPEAKKTGSAIDSAGEYEDGGIWGIECYFGKRKSGKSTRLGVASRSVKRLLLIDLRGASPESQNFFDRFGFERTFQQPGPLREFLRSRIDQPFRVLYQPVLPPPAPPKYDNKGKLIRPPDLLGLHFAAVSTIVIAMGHMIYAIDEVDRVTSAGFAPPALDYLINQGRHVQVSMEVTSRRPAQIPRELTSQAHRFVVFRMTEPADLDYLQDYIGRAARESLPALTAYRSLEWEETDGISYSGGKNKSLN